MARLLLGGPDGLDLLAGPYAALVGTDWGMWQAVTSSTESLFVDGSIVTGESSGNRTIALQVRVQEAWRPALVAACEALFVAANQPANELWFVPDDGPVVVYEVFRAQPERTDDQSETWQRRTYTLTFPARPFTRSASRVSVAAAAPGVVLAGFDAASSGVDIRPPARGSGNPGGWTSYNGAALSTVFKGLPAAMTGLTNCTYTIGVHGNFNAVQVTATASGVVEAAQDAAFAVAGAVVAVSLGGYFEANPRPHYQAGIEWLDASDAVLGVDWSEPQFASISNSLRSGYGPYFAARRPAAATKARVRLRVPDASPATTYYFTEFTVSDVAASALPVAGSPHDGSGALQFLSPGFASAALASPVALAADGGVSVWVQSSISTVAYGWVTLHDTSGRWSRWGLSGLPQSGESGVWKLGTASLDDEPSAVSTLGPVDLSAVSAWTLSFASPYPENPFYGLTVDTLIGGPPNSVLTTQHGSVVQLDISGSARSTVALTVSNATPMTDVLLAAAAPDVSPMLPVAASVATAPAPAAYGGAYRVLGALVPASTEVNPTCLVTQYVGGVSVATQTLTGTMQTGNHYCDFGTVGLPLVGFPADNGTVSYTFTLSPSDTDWAEVLLLDTDAPSVWIPNMSTARSRVWVDEPLAGAPLGNVWVGSNEDRSDARSPAATPPPDLNQPFQVRAPSTRMLAYSTSGAPDVTLDYYPRYLVEPTE